MKSLTESMSAVIAHSAFPMLRDYIVAATGLEYYTEKPLALAEQVAGRIAELDLVDCRAYLECLRDPSVGETELDNLIVTLTIGETHFFRHREIFDALRDVALPEILERNRATKTLRIWSAGCSTGAEAYSLSILLRREMRHAFAGWKVSIIGTDINRTVLSRAMEGRYEDWAFRGTTPDLRRECFEEVPSAKSWHIAPEFKEGVTFHYHNLVRHPFPSLAHNLVAFDLILCRNVLIYFAPEVVRHTISHFAECLLPGGWLAVGHSENSEQFQNWFEVVNVQGATLHRKPLSNAAEGSENSLKTKSNRPPKHPHSRLIRTKGSSVTTSTPRSHRSAPPSKTPKSTPRSSSAEVERVRALADQGNIVDAWDLCRSVANKHPRSPVVHFYSGLLLDQMARHRAALNAFERAINLEQGFVLAHYYSGLVQHKLANTSAAAKSFRNVMHLLEGQERSDSLPNGEGLNVGELLELANMHVETLNTT